MLKFLVCLCMVSTAWPSSFAQAQLTDPDPTRWITFSQSYLKIPIVQDGLYRIRTADLKQAGVPIHQIHPASFQLFRRGIEQAIWVAGEADGQLDEADYLEFYGVHNDGAQDSLLYTPHRAQPHAYYSLYSDTAAYFLTWRLDGKPGKRMAAVADTSMAGADTIRYHWANAFRLFTDTYPAGTIYPLGATVDTGVILSNYDVGEGWTGPLISANQAFDQTITIANVVRKTVDGRPLSIHLTYGVVGRNARQHRVHILGGPTKPSMIPLDTLRFSAYTMISGSVEQPIDTLAPQNELILSFQPQEPAEQVSVSYLNVRYPQQTDLSTDTQKVLVLDAWPQNRSLLPLTHAQATSRVFDISDPTNPTPIVGKWQTGTWLGVLAASPTSRTLIAVNQPLPTPPLQLVSFRPLANKTATFIVITHPLLRQSTPTLSDPVQAYAAYRASEAGGHFDTLTVTIDELFNLYSYGERHPLAIRRFAASCVSAGATRPIFLFLVGQSRDPQGIRKNPLGPLLDLVPNAGWPGSDLLLVSGLTNAPVNVPALAIGRLNASTPQQVLAYLTKIKEHEQPAAPALWHKNVLHLSGGQTQDELLTFRSFIADFSQAIEGPFVGARVTSLSKTTDKPAEALPISTPVNQGVGLITLLGHSSLDVTDVALGFVSNDLLNYRNKGRYPFLLVDGCAAGNVFYGRPTFGNDWVLTPDRGAIAFLAHTYNGFTAPLKRYTDVFYRVLTDSLFIGKAIGELQQETIRRYLAQNTSIFDVTTAQQMTLLGDPAVRLFPFTRPDVGFLPTSVQLQQLPGNTTATDSVRLTSVVANFGRVTPQPITVRIRQYRPNGQLLQEKLVTIPTPAYADTLVWKMPMPTTSTDTTLFELVLDPDNLLSEETKHNNRTTITSFGITDTLPFTPDTTPPILSVAFDGQQIQDGDYVSAKPHIELLLADDNDKLPPPDSANLDVRLYFLGPMLTNFPSPILLPTSRLQWSTDLVQKALRVHLTPNAAWPDGQYRLLATGSDQSGNRAMPYQIHFSVQNESTFGSLVVSPNPFSQQTCFTFLLTGTTPPPNLSITLLSPDGRPVKTIQHKAHIGRNEWYWDGTSDSGAPLPAGVYVFTLRGLDDFPAVNANRTGRVVINR